MPDEPVSDEAAVSAVKEAFDAVEAPVPGGDA